MEGIPERTIDECGAEKEPLPLRPHRRINYDLLYQYVRGRYPRILRRLEED